MTQNLQTILNDKQSGSFNITKMVLNYLRDSVTILKREKKEAASFYNQLQTEVKSILKVHTHMVLLRKLTTNFLANFKRLINSNKGHDEIVSQLLDRLDEMSSELRENVDKITHNGSRIIANSNKVMTISNSTLVLEIILMANSLKRKFEVFCLKSHPADEGIEFARTLAEAGIKTTVIADSEMGLFLPEMNLVLVGADRIFNDGFINKSGTHPLCICAKHFNIPVYLAAETIKILPEKDRAIKQQEQNPGEVCDIKHHNLSARNIYFEQIPLSLIHKIICEDSVFETHEFIKWYLEE